jgi:hypothetical protein
MKRRLGLNHARGLCRRRTRVRRDTDSGHAPRPPPFTTRAA